MDGLFLLAVAVVGGTIGWCRVVPDPQARLRGLICIWAALPLVDAALFVLNRLYGLY